MNQLIACAIILIASAAPVLAQGRAPASIQAEMLKDWTDLKETLMKIANEMPAEGYSFRPTPPQETFGRRVVHIAVGGKKFLELMGGKKNFPPEGDARGGGEEKKTPIQGLPHSCGYGAAIF